MPTYASPVDTYNDTTLRARVITDVISLIDPVDTPIIDALGGLDGASGKFTFVNEKNTQVEWAEDTYLPVVATLNGSLASNTTTVTVGSADINNIQKGHILLVGTEHMLVTSDPNRSAYTFTVTRAFAGTTAATQASNATANIIGEARMEGEDSTSIGYTDRYTGTNYTQIWHQEVKATRTSRQVNQYGVSDELMYQADKAVPQLTRLMERHLINNAASNAGNNTTTPRVAGGIQAFVTTNLIDGSSLTQAKFENALKAAYTYGGQGPWLAFVSPTNLVKIKGFYETSSFLRVDRTETTVGMLIKDIITPFGNATLVLDRWMPDGKIFIIDAKHAGLKTFYPFTQEPLAKVGDSDRAQVVGEFTFCLRQEKAHAILTGVS